MLRMRGNFHLFLVFIKRYLADSSFKGNKHYEYFVRHIKTCMNNRSYIIKQTTAIPKQISNLSIICDRNTPSIVGLQTSYSPLLPSLKHSNFTIANEKSNKFLDKNALIPYQDVVSKRITHYSTKEHSRSYNCDILEAKNSYSHNGTESYYAQANGYRDEIFDNNNGKEYIDSNHQEDYIHPAQLDNHTNRFSLTKIKELLSKKIKDTLMNNINKNLFSDDVVILIQKVPERESLIFSKNNDLHVIESSHTNFKNDVKNYIKNIDCTERSVNTPERLNLIRFSKVNSSDNLFDEPDNSSYSKDHFSVWSDSQCNLDYSRENSWKRTLKVKESALLEQNTVKFWIPYEEDSNNGKVTHRDNFEKKTSQSYSRFFPQSGPPFTEKVPINKDKLIEEKVVPNTSILNIINSIDKSAMIIQKDLYITDQIIQKIQKEKEKDKVIDKNKLETTANNAYTMYLEPPSATNGMFPLSLEGSTADSKSVLLNNSKKELNNANNKQSLVNTKRDQQSSLSRKNVNQTSNGFNNHICNDSPASVILRSIDDDDGKISLNMLYEPNKVVPMFSFVPKKIFMEAESDITTGSLNYYNDRSEQSNHEGNPNHSTTPELQDNNHQLLPISQNRLKQLETEFLQQKTITNNEKKTSNNFKEKPKHDDRSQHNSLKDCNTGKKILKYNSCKTSPGEGMSTDFYVNHFNTPNNSKNIKYQLSNNELKPLEQTKDEVPSVVKKSLSDDLILSKETSDSDMNSSHERIPFDNVTNSNNSVPNSQDNSYKLLVISNGQMKNLEKEFSKLKKLNESEKKKSSGKLSVIEKSFETLLKDNILKKEISVSNDLKNESEKQYPKTPKENFPDTIKSLDTLLKNYIATRISVPNNMNNESGKKKSSETLSVIEKSLEILLKDNILNKKISVSNDLKNESEKQYQKIPKENFPVTIKSLYTLLKNYIANREISVPNNMNNESRKKKIELSKEEYSLIAQNLLPLIVKSMETLLKNNSSKREISNDMKNEFKKQSLETFKQEPSHIESDVINSLKTLLENHSSKREKSVSNNLKNQSEKKDIEIPKEEPNQIAQHIAQIVKKSLETWLKDKIPKTGISVSNGLKCSETPVEEPSYLTPINNKTNSNDKDALLNNNQILENMNDEKLSEENIQESNDKSQYTLTDQINSPQLYSVVHADEANNKKDTMKPSIPKEGSCLEKGVEVEKKVKTGRAILSDKNSLRDGTNSYLFKVSNNKSNQPLSMKSDEPFHGLSSSISDNSGKGKGLSNGRKNVKKSNKFVPTTKKLGSSNTKKSSVDCVKQTTISSVEKNNYTNINVSEVEKYVDSRLPVPFSTETFFQIFGSKDSLRSHSSLIDVTKYKLSAPNRITEEQSNQYLMAKLDSIHKNVQHLNILAMNSLKSKNAILKDKTHAYPKETPKRSSNNQEIVKHSTKEYKHSKIESPVNGKQETINEEKTPIFIPKFSLKVFKDNNLAVKAHLSKQKIKKNLEDRKDTSETKMQDLKTSLKDEKGLLIVESKNEKIDETTMNQKRPGIQKVALTGIRASRGKYVDLINFNKNLKNKKIQGQKKGVYDHRGLSKRDKKILREITKEIPKQKSKGKSSRKRPIRPITSKKNGNSIVQTTSIIKNSNDTASNIALPKGDSESVTSTALSNTHLSNKPILLSSGKHGTEKIENTSYKAIPKVGKISEIKKVKDIKLGKTAERITISAAKATNAIRFNLSKKTNLNQVTKSENNSTKNSESRNTNIDKNTKKPLCQTYVATETYVSQPEKIHQIPEKVFTSKKMSKKNPSSQKIEALENIKSNKEDNSNTIKIQDGFREELIRKSQNKIEHRTNIEYKARTPKLKYLKSKLKTLNRKEKKNLSPPTVSEKMPMPKKDSKITDVENEHFKIKKHLKNKLDRSSKEIKTSKKTGTIKKTTSAQNIKNEEVQKLNQPEPSNKETFSLHKSKTSEIINTKPIGKMAKRTEKQHDNGQLKIVANDTLIPPRESKNSQSENIDKKNFPMFLIDVDKMSKEIKPELDSKKCQICQVPHEKIVDFPLHNQNKKLLFKAPFRILNHGPASDPMLRSELKLFPSITKILNSTIPESSREILREWRKNMIDELGENGFKSFYKGQLINGNKFNWELHNFLLIGEKHKQESNNLSLKSIDNVLRRTSDLSAINSHVIHRKLAYRGVIDCVAKYKNKPVLIEWKRLENPEVKVSNSSIDMAATQLSAYVGALNFDETYKFQISGGLLVLAYNDGSEAEVIEINHEQCYKYWKMWLTRLQKYQESRKKTT